MDDTLPASSVSATALDAYQKSVDAAAVESETESSGAIDVTCRESRQRRWPDGTGCYSRVEYEEGEDPDSEPASDQGRDGGRWCMDEDLQSELKVCVYRCGPESTQTQQQRTVT